MSRSTAPLERITQVGVGNAVTLRFPHGNDGGSFEITHTITERDHDPENGKYSKDSVLGSLLLGKSLGEKVEIPQPEENVAEGTIADIS